MRRAIFWSGALLLACAVSTAVATAQEGGASDQWFVLDKFSGLNLLLEKSQLPVGSALIAKNCQFSKQGTISVLPGLTSRKIFSSTVNYQILGLGNIEDYINDSDRIIVACSTFFWNTYGNSWTDWDKSTAAAAGTWRSWKTDSVLWLDTLGTGRAAEFWRPGWKVEFSIPGPGIQYRSINYIIDNSRVFLTSAPDTSYIGTSANRVHPLPGSTTATVRFVNVEVDGVPMVVCLQPGMEPILYNGNSLSSMRYFGIADSGWIQKLHQAPMDSSKTYIVDNTKLGLYGDNELADKGYWLHLPYTYSPYDDTSQWGRVWQIDSNLVDTLTDTSFEFRIYFQPSTAVTTVPGGSWADSAVGTRYSILSAPFLREVVASGAKTATFIDGGIYVRVDTSVADAHQTDHVPHMVAILADSVNMPRWDTVITCEPRESSIEEPDCDTQIVGVNSYYRLGKFYTFPVRTIMPGATGDSLLIWTSGENVGSGLTDFVTDKWQLWKLTIPYASDGIVYRNRLYLAGDPQSPNSICYSDKAVVRGPKVGAFPEENLIELTANGDVFTGFALIYNWLVAFQRRHTWLLKGDPADGYTFELALPDEGCIAINSITTIGNEVFYRSEKGLRLFDGNNARDFAEQIRPAVQGVPRTTYVTSQSNRSKCAASYEPTTHNVWISMPFGTATTNNGSFIYNYVDGSFSYSDEVYGGLIKNFSFLDTLWTVFTHPTKGQIYTQGYTDSLTPTGIDGDSMMIEWQSGWMDFGNPLERKFLGEGASHIVQGCPTVLTNRRKVYIDFYRDFDTVAYYSRIDSTYGIAAGVFYGQNRQLRLEPQTADRGFQWLKIGVRAYGMSIFDVQRLAVRWRGGADIVRDGGNGFRP